MRWAASHSVLPDPAAAVEQASGAVRRALDGGEVDLAVAFFTSPLAADPEALAEGLKRALAPRCLIGASGGAVIASEREIEQGPALTLIAARLPGVELKPFILSPTSWGEAMDDPLEFARHTPASAAPS